MVWSFVSFLGSTRSWGLRPLSLASKGDGLGGPKSSNKGRSHQGAFTPMVLQPSLFREKGARGPGEKAPSPPPQALSPDLGRPAGFRTFGREAERPQSTASKPRRLLALFTDPKFQLLGSPHSWVEARLPDKADGLLTSPRLVLRRFSMAPTPLQRLHVQGDADCVRSSAPTTNGTGDERHQPISAQKTSIVPPLSPALIPYKQSSSPCLF